MGTARLRAARQDKTRTRKKQMKIAVITIKGISPYSQSKHHETPMHDKEGPEDYDRRTWREKLHYNKEGEVFIPPMAFKNCLSEIASFLGMKIIGKGNATYTKHFESGILITDPVMLGINMKEVESETLFVPSDGKRGGGKRVYRTFPVIREGWTGKLTVYILDDTITKKVFEIHIKEAGKFKGVGRFRPSNNGFYGRFEVIKIEWKEAR
jgi:hypothetical protein